MIKILIVGKNSLLAENFIKYIRGKIKYKAITHKEVKKTKLEDYCYIINFSISPKFLKTNLKDKDNLDIILAKKIFKNKKCKLVFLNSRKIYKPKENIKENSNILLNNFYERNKYKTEIKLKKLLKNRLLSLRISNVIGIKKNKKKRIHKTFLDNFYDYKKSKKKVIVNNDFKDFITTTQFSKILKLLILKNATGIFNVSIGKKIFAKNIVYWLDKSFYKKIYFLETNLRNSFTLNNKKLLKKIKIKIKIKELKSFIKKL